MSGQLTRVHPAEYTERAARQECHLPLEQSEVWDKFDALMNGRAPQGKYVYQVDGQDRAFVSFSRMKGRGFVYWWAKHGPVWLSEPTGAEESAFIDAVIELARRDRQIAFVRMHAQHRDPRQHELLQSVTFDRTVILDLTADEDAILAGMKKRGRRDVRKALRAENLEVHDETERYAEVFPELYELLTETASRDGFGVAPRQTYETMLGSLGHHARLYTVRSGKQALCWGIVTVNGPLATYYYAASSAEARKVGAPDLLIWEMCRDLKSRGVAEFDLMGIDSPRAPQLSGVRGFKTKFSEDIAEVAGAWDIPVHPFYYEMLVRALVTKRWASGKLVSVRERLSRANQDQNTEPTD